MTSMFTYLWQSALVLTVLYIPFQLLLRKEHFFALNRAILLGILLLSLTLPLSRHTMPMFVDNWLHTEVDMVEAVPFSPLGEYQDWDGYIIIESGDIEEPSSIEIHWTDLLIALWFLGTTVFLAWYSRGLWRLYKILHDKDNVREMLADGNTLLLTLCVLPSFSWMHSIVISQEDYAENGETILTHERAHIAHNHSYDRLLLFVVQAVQWWNPFVWLMADALSQVHEYQADLAVLRQGFNATQYQLLLIRKAAGPAGLSLVNGFKRNKLKLRIVMMNNMIKLRGAKSRYVALLPVALLAFALTAKAQEPNQEVIQDKNNQVHSAVVNAFDESLLTSGEDLLSQQDAEFAASLQRPNDRLIMYYMKKNDDDEHLDSHILSEEKLEEFLANPKPDYVIERYEPEDPNIPEYCLQHPNSKNGVVILHPKWKSKPAEQNVKIVGAGFMPPREKDHYTLEELDMAPEFPDGGNLKNYIGRNLRYPKSAAEKGIQGTVIVGFSVMKDGSIAHVKTVHNESFDKELETEAIRVVSSMPNWIPGKINDQNVNTSMYVPITFRLNSTPVKHTIGDMPYTEDMLFVYDGNVVNLSDIRDLVPEECGINGMSLYHDGYYVDQYIDKYPKAKNGVVMINSFMKNSSLFVIDGEPMNFQTMRQKYPEGLSPIKYHINHKDAETIAKYSQYPEAKNGVNIIITDK